MIVTIDRLAHKGGDEMNSDSFFGRTLTLVEKLRVLLDGCANILKIVIRTFN